MTSAVRTRRVASLAAAALLVAAHARAQDSLPTADRILARYHEVVGAPAFAAIRSLHSTGRIAIPAAGMNGSIEIWQGRPNRTRIRATIPGLGEVQTGFTGTAAWSIDPTEGPRLLTGAEGTQATDDANFDSHLRPPELVQSVTAIERTTVSGYDCYKVRTVWKSGRETLDCFSVDTGLLVTSQRTHHSSTGATDALVIYEEYREFDGARLPTRITTRFDTVDQIITLENTTLNGVPDSAFVPPEPVRSLIGG